jgi:hypothetical protein
MIDGIKTLNLITNLSKLEKNADLSEYWKNTVRNDSGEILEGSAKFNGLIFSVKNGVCSLNGSLHKYKNHGLHNYDDFSAVDVAEVVWDIERRFEVSIHTTEINGLEWGVNVVLPFAVNRVLDNLITYKGVQFLEGDGKDMEYYECKLTHFRIKIYDKGKQFNLPDNVLRVEISANKRQYLETKKISLRYFSDLLKRDIYEPLGNILIEVFENILFGDNTLDESKLSEKEVKIFLRGNNPKTWKTPKDETERKRLYRLEKSYKEILERYGTGVNVQRVVLELIKNKWSELSRIYRPDDLEIVPYLPLLKEEENGEKKPKLSQIYILDEKVNTGHTDNKKSSKKVKKCSGCGLPLLPHQKTYHNEDCRNRKTERNARSNPRNWFKEKYSKAMRMPSLFDDVTQHFKLNPQQSFWINQTKTQ